MLDSANHRLTYCNCGHNPPLLVRADGSATELEAAGAVLGQFPQWSYEQSELQMQSRDKLLIFTDGLVEACNANDEFFGEQTLIDIARQNLNSSAEDLMATLIRAASQHTAQHFQDDASLIVLKAAAAQS